MEATLKVLRFRVPVGGPLRVPLRVPLRGGFRVDNIEALINRKRVLVFLSIITVKYRVDRVCG